MRDLALGSGVGQGSSSSFRAPAGSKARGSCDDCIRHSLSASAQWRGGGGEQIARPPSRARDRRPRGRIGIAIAHTHGRISVLPATRTRLQHRLGLDAHAILDAILFEFNQIATARQPRSPELCPPSAPVLPPIAPIAPASAAAASSQYIDIDLLHLYSSRHKDGRRHAMASYPTPSTYALN